MPDQPNQGKSDGKRPPGPSRALVTAAMTPADLSRPPEPLAASKPLPLGSMLGKYRLTEVLGHGGMGTVYAAEDSLIKRKVAIKVLSPQLAPDPNVINRLLAEAQAAGKLNHPNVVTIYDVGEHDGLPFIAMEFVRGDTFADLVCLRPPLPVLRKVQLAEEVHADLLVVGNIGLSSVAGRLLGAVPSEVSRRAKTDVLIVHTTN